MAEQKQESAVTRQSLDPHERGETLVVRKLLPATRDEVFAAWTDAESLRQWMCAGDATEARATLDVRVGGTFRIDMIAGSAVYEHTGEYLEVDPPRRLVFTWVSRGTNHRRTVVTVELHEDGDETELVLTHEGLPSAEAARKHHAGWSSIVEKLAAELGG
jgi:uncharacterized protein YndB with AHSA1/START domain